MGSTGAIARLTDEQKLRFKRNGFLVLRNAIDEDLCAEARSILREIIDEDPDDPTSLVERDGDHDEILHRGSSSEAAERMTESHVRPFERMYRQVYPYAEQLVGEGVLADPDERPAEYCLHGGHLMASREEGGAVVDHDGAIGPILQYPSNLDDDLEGFDYTKARHVDGGTGPYAVGADVTYLPFTIAAAIYFDTVEPRGGGFTVWPGSHRKTEKYFEDHTYHDYVTSDEDVLENLDLGPALEITGEPGTLVLWHHNIAHAAAPNHSERLRMAGFQRIANEDMAEIGEDALSDIWMQYPAIRDLEPDVHESY